MKKTIHKIFLQLKGLFYISEPSRYTAEEALEIARKYHLEEGVKMAMEQGLSPDEALQDWDIYQYDEK